VGRGRFGLFRQFGPHKTQVIFVTTPRTDIHIAADLKGQSSTERGLSLIGLAARDFREDPRKQAKILNLL
jgi:acyl-CoA hydrolase